METIQRRKASTPQADRAGQAWYPLIEIIVVSHMQYWLKI